MAKYTKWFTIEEENREQKTKMKIQFRTERKTFWLDIIYMYTYLLHALYTSAHKLYRFHEIQWQLIVHKIQQNLHEIHVVEWLFAVYSVLKYVQTTNHKYQSIWRLQRSHKYHHWGINNVKCKVNIEVKKSKWHRRYGTARYTRISSWFESIVMCKYELKIRKRTEFNICSNVSHMHVIE